MAASPILNHDQILEVLSLSQNATAVYTTQDIVIQYANDAMIAFWGKDRGVIGKPLEEAVPELRGQPFKKMLQDVLATGVSNIGEAIPAELMVDGELQTYYYDYQYRAVKNASGQTYCILHTAADVTEQEVTRIQLQKAKDLEETQKAALIESEERFRALVEQSPIAITVLRSRDLIIDIVNDKMLEIWGKEPQIQGMPLALAMPELTGQPFLQIMDDVLTTGKPFYGFESKAHIIRNGERIEGYFNFICQPIKDMNGEINSILQVVTEITDQVTARLRVQESEQMTRFAVDAAKLGAWHINPQTKALTYNDTLAKLFGYEGEQPMTYEQAINQVTDDYRDLITAAIDKAITQGGDYDISYSQRRFNDGELIWLRSLGKISADEKGDYTVFSGFVMDITEQKKDEERKSDFIGMVSHELKTPLTSLSAIVQVANLKLQKNEDTFLTGAMHKANVQVKRMSNMINGFLNISRLESGKLTIDKQKFNLDELTREVIGEMELTISTHVIDINDCPAIPVFADRDKIGSVITNLLSNAVKYSPLGKTIKVDCSTADGMVTVSVTDEGIGMQPQDAEKIFDRYYRVESNHTQHISGFGIGLYLSSEIVKRHNGKIWVTSEPGVGSTFYFSLPL